MVFETTTSLDGTAVLAAATRFFAHRNPATAAFPEHGGPGWQQFRGQGGEEIALAVTPIEGGTQVRGSSLLFDQLVDRFLTTLPPLAAFPFAVATDE